MLPIDWRNTELAILEEMEGLFFVGKSTIGAEEVIVPPVVRSSLQGNANVATPKAIGYWLLGMSGLVAGMVTIGGITRLTRSGLSMTDWKLQGTLPPMNHEEWMREFDRYKQFPEWQQRKNMTLDEFKFIFIGNTDTA